ncbi:MAG: type II toxin-antitoxin system HipA family toxin [Flexibacteraceae bacterium]
MTKDIFVFADFYNQGKPEYVGTLNVQILRGKEVFSFQYAKDWLSNGKPFLDPDLQYFEGSQYPMSDKLNFGLFMDSSPDRWGRTVMKRKEAIMAKLEQRKPNVLLESDFLLGVFDGYRQGALRFKLDFNGSFLNDDLKLTAPPITSLRTLEYAVEQMEDESLPNNEQQLEWLNLLLAPGSSLGGARPKAGVVNTDGALWIAKFPSKYDEVNNAAWEMLAIKLAEKCGLHISESMLLPLTKSNKSCFLTKRFDRQGENRIHFASAMTLLGYTDGNNESSGVSYLEIAEFISSYSFSPEIDLKELWKRIVFSILVKNTDDHLRNHGFLLKKEGWVLSPAYDLNPNPNGLGLSLNVNENSNALDLDLALEVSDYFRLTQSEGNQIIKDVQDILKDWRSVAIKLGINRNEQEQLATIFE